MLLADTLNISPGGKTPMFFPERQPAGLALCSGCFITFSWWCCEWILMPVVTHQQNATGKYWARLQEGKTDVSEMRGQTLCYSVLLPVALYSTAWTVDLSCLSQTNSLPQFSSCLHDLYVSQCFLVEIEGSFRLGYGLFFVGGGLWLFCAMSWQIPHRWVQMGDQDICKTHGSWKGIVPAQKRIFSPSLRHEFVWCRIYLHYNTCGLKGSFISRLFF